jgi:hypothetical protein
LRTLTYTCVNPLVFGGFIVSFFSFPRPKRDIPDPPLAAPPLGTAILLPNKMPLPGGVGVAPNLGCDGDGERL